MKRPPTTELANERGVVTVMFTVLLIFLMLMIAVVAEGGRKLSNLSRAEDIAAEAARAAAATLDQDTIAYGVPVVAIEEDGRPRDEAEKIIAFATGAEIVDFTVSGDSVFVSVRVRGDSFVPGLNIDGVGSHTAQAIDPFRP